MMKHIIIQEVLNILRIKKLAKKNKIKKNVKIKIYMGNIKRIQIVNQFLKKNKKVNMELQD